jgi:hypothetical protein
MYSVEQWAREAEKGLKRSQERRALPKRRWPISAWEILIILSVLAALAAGAILLSRVK